MSSPSDPKNIRHRAQQGEPKAIAQLLNRTLRNKDIKVQVQRKDTVLFVRLNSDAPLPAKQTMSWLYRYLEKLQLQNIERVRVQGKQRSVEKPIWEKSSTLKKKTTLPPSTAKSKSSSPIPLDSTISSEQPIADSKPELTNPFQAALEEEITNTETPVRNFRQSSFTETSDVINPFDEEPSQATDSPVVQISDSAPPASENLSVSQPDTWLPLHWEWAIANSFVAVIICWLMPLRFDGNLLLLKLLIYVGHAYVQTCVMSRRLSKPWRWFMATVVGSVLSLGIVSQGIVQWFVLKSETRNASLWVKANIVAGLFSAAFFLRESLENPFGSSSSLSLRILMSITWLIQIGVTTIALRQLLSKKPEHLRSPEANLLAYLKSFFCRPNAEQLSSVVEAEQARSSLAATQEAFPPPTLKTANSKKIPTKQPPLSELWWHWTVLGVQANILPIVLTLVTGFILAFTKPSIIQQQPTVLYTTAGLITMPIICVLIGNGQGRLLQPYLKKSASIWRLLTIFGMAIATTLIFLIPSIYGNSVSLNNANYLVGLGIPGFVLGFLQSLVLFRSPLKQYAWLWILNSTIAAFVVNVLMQSLIVEVQVRSGEEFFSIALNLISFLVGLLIYLGFTGGTMQSILVRRNLRT